MFSKLSIILFASSIDFPIKFSIIIEVDDILIGKSIEEANSIIDNFENMINEKEYQKDILQNAIVYDEIYKQNSRRTCAFLPYKGIREALDKYKK